jgi:NAD/NADP transhydrogenase beta subunit
MHAAGLEPTTFGSGHGFAGIDNTLFYHEKTRMLFADARQSLTQVGQALKSA